jgi:hypothetical protein
MTGKRTRLERMASELVENVESTTRYHRRHTIPQQCAVAGARAFAEAFKEWCDAKADAALSVGAEEEALHWRNVVVSTSNPSNAKSRN